MSADETTDVISKTESVLSEAPAVDALARARELAAKLAATVGSKRRAADAADADAGDGDATDAERDESSEAPPATRRKTDGGADVGASEGGGMGHWKNECNMKAKWEEFMLPTKAKWEEFLKSKDKKKGTDKKKVQKEDKETGDANDIRLTAIEKALSELTASLTVKRKPSEPGQAYFTWLGGLDGTGLHDENDRGVFASFIDTLEEGYDDIHEPHY
jgi:hypothetical protein